ncbi:MAG: hypothetical protein AAGK78_01160, partial [Planctomycetota bacterium]
MSTPAPPSDAVSLDTPLTPHVDLRWPLLVVALVALLLLPLVVRHTYLYDDPGRINDDRLTSPTGWQRLLTEPYNDGVDNLYRPITSYSFAVQAVLFGTDESDAWSYHAINALLHAGVSVLVAALAFRLMGTSASRAWVAMIAGCLFAMHPVHAEVVGMVVGRGELLCAVGFLGATLLVLGPLTRGQVVGIVALTLLAIGSKEQGLVLPAMLGVIFLARRMTGETLSSNGHGKLLAASLLLPLAAYLIFRESILPFTWNRGELDPTIQPFRDATGFDRWAFWLPVLGHALRLLVWPASLSIDYGTAVIQPPVEVGDPFLWLGVLALLLWTAGVKARSITQALGTELDRAGRVVVNADWSIPEHP